MTKFKKNDRVYFESNGVESFGTVDHYVGRQVWCLFDGNKALSWMFEHELTLIEKEVGNMKIYKGFETLERMKTHWITDEKKSSAWMIKEDGLVWMKTGDLVGVVNEKINFFLENEFTDYVEPVKVGEWVARDGVKETFVFKVKNVFGEDYEFEGCSDTKFTKSLYRKATSEEIAQEKHRLIFKNLGRKVDEFKEKDGVLYDNYFYLVSKIEADQILITEGSSSTHEVDAKDLKLIYPVEHMINLEE